MSGLLFDGRVVPVPGVDVISPNETEWAHLSSGDGRARHGVPQMFILHTTKGEWPQRIIDGAGPPGRCQRTAEMWLKDPTYSGAHGVTGSDGKAACLADIIRRCAYHATFSNDRAGGWEIYQEPGGVIYRAAIDATVKICEVVADVAMIPRQVPRRPYLGHPLARMLKANDGGRDVYGFLGHRDNTEDRGKGDPGEAIFLALIAAGFEPLDFAAGEDLAIWKRRQALLNAMGEKLVVDGLPGYNTMKALRRRGFRCGRDLLPA